MTSNLKKSCKRLKKRNFLTKKKKNPANLINKSNQLLMREKPNDNEDTDQKTEYNLERIHQMKLTDDLLNYAKYRKLTTFVKIPI